MKRLFRLLWDLLDILGRADVAWGLLKLTKVGNWILAVGSAVIVLIVAAARSDPWMSGVIFAGVVFAVVAGVAQATAKINSRPKLKYGGITGLQFEFGTPQFGTEEGGFLYGESFLRPLLVRVTNTQQSIAIAANNVRALIDYTHHDDRDRIKAVAVWASVGKRGAEFPDRMQIESGQTTHFVLVHEYPSSPNQALPNPKKTTDYLVTGNIFEGSPFKKLGAGHWTVLIEVTSDNSAPLVLKGGFTITRDDKIKFDTPALRKLGT